MKKIYLLLLSAIAIASLSSCSIEENDLFGKSAATRLNESVASYQELLESNDSGWVMEFMPSEGEYGGYVYAAKFKGGNVDMAGEIALSNSSTGEVWAPGTIVSSKYSVKSEQSVILTFDTYNTIFHFFSEPHGSSDTDGYASDYEFVFMGTSADKDTIYLRGKKYDNELRMYKLNTSISDYVKSVVESDENVSQVNRTAMVIGDKSYPISIEDKILSFTNIDNDSTVTDIPLIFNDKGFRLYTPITLNGITYENFEFDSQTGDVKSEDGSAKISCPSAYDQFFNSKYSWFFQADAAGKYEMSDGLYTSFTKVLKPVSTYTFQYAYFGDDTMAADINKGYKKCFRFYWTYLLLGTYTINTNAYYGIDITVDNEANGIYTINGLGSGYSYSGSKKTACDPFINAVLNNSPYKADFNEGVVKKTVKFTSTTDPNIWFTLKLNTLIK
jgi:hypothetical protein